MRTAEEIYELQRPYWTALKDSDDNIDSYWYYEGYLDVLNHRSDYSKEINTESFVEAYQLGYADALGDLELTNGT